MESSIMAIIIMIKSKDMAATTGVKLEGTSATGTMANSMASVLIMI